MSITLVYISALILESATKFETAFIDDPDEVLLIYDTTNDKPMEPENSVGSIRVDPGNWVICKFGEETMFFVDALDAAVWMIGKELESITP